MFEVTKNKEVPFSVNTKGLLITVHGTVFNVNSYDKTVKTTLLHGSISASANSKELYLKPNQSLSYANNEMKIANIEAQNSTAWSRGVLWFENASLKEILTSLQRNYQLSYQIDEQHLNKHYTASFKTEEGVANILKTLSAVSGLSLTIKNQVIVVQ
ncbi:fec operon regulator FecR [compost metagenome]